MRSNGKWNLTGLISVRHIEINGELGPTIVSSGRAADFFVQILNDETQPLIEHEFFDYLLPKERIVDVIRDPSICQHFHVVQIGKVSIDFSGQLASFRAQLRIELENFRSERFGFDRGRRFRFQRLDRGDRKWRLLFEAGEANTFKSLQNQAGCSVAATDASTDETDAGDVKEIFGRMPLRTTRFDERDGKHAVMIERVLEHFAVTLFKNIERKQGVWK